MRAALANPASIAVGVDQIRANVPDVHVGIDVDQAGLVACQPRFAIAELRIDPLHVGSKLVAHLRDGRRHRRDIEFGAAQLLSVFDEILRNLVRQRPEHQVHRVLKERAIRPHRGGPGHAFAAVRDQGGLGKTPFQFAQDALRVAIDVGADLHHGRAPIAAGQRHQIGTRHDPRDAHGGPCDVLQPENDPDLFREGRLIEMVEDDRRSCRHKTLVIWPHQYR